MKTSLKFLILNFSFLIVSCAHYPIYDHPGTIMFTSELGFEMRLFTSDTVLIAHEYYELGKSPIIIRVKESGEYLLEAESETKKTVQKWITYHSGNVEYFIEF